MAKRTRLEAQETRDRIIRVATQLFQEQGFARTTISDICQAAEISKGALFHHFDTKEALFEEIWLSLETRMDKAATAAAIAKAQESDDPYEIFMAGCRIFVEYVSQKPFQQIVNIDGPVVLGREKWIKHDAEMGLRNIGSGLRYLETQGLVSPDNRKALTVLLYGALQGIAQTLSSGQAQTTAEEMLAAFEHLVRHTR